LRIMKAPLSFSSGKKSIEMDTDEVWNDLRKRSVDGIEDLVIAVIKSEKTQKVLMVAYQDFDAFKRTMETRIMHYYSTSKNRSWKKGEKSGNIQKVVDIRKDCDGDALLYIVDQTGGSCHMGYETCFYRDLDDNIKEERVFDPREVYT